jgi:hypothetical protein
MDFYFGAKDEGRHPDTRKWIQDTDQRRVFVNTTIKYHKKRGNF